MESAEEKQTGLILLLSVSRIEEGKEATLTAKIFLA